MSQLIIIFSILGVMGIAILLLGLKIITKKVFFVDSRIMFSFIVVGFLPMLINSTYDLIKPKTFGNNFISVIPILLFIIMIVVFNKAFGKLTIFNVTEDILYESLIEVFSRKGITCEEKRSQIFLKEVDASIKIGINSMMNTAQISIIKPQNIQDIKGIYKDLQDIFSQKTFKGRTLIGIVYILLGILLLIMLIGLLILQFK